MNLLMMIYSINKNKDKLLGTKSTGSKDQLLNRLAQKGVTIIT